MSSNREDCHRETSEQVLARRFLGPPPHAGLETSGLRTSPALGPSCPSNSHPNPRPISRSTRMQKPIAPSSCLFVPFCGNSFVVPGVPQSRRERRSHVSRRKSWPFPLNPTPFVPKTHISSLGRFSITRPLFSPQPESSPIITLGCGRSPRWVQSVACPPSHHSQHDPRPSAVPPPSTPKPPESLP